MTHASLQPAAAERADSDPDPGRLVLSSGGGLRPVLRVSKQAVSSPDVSLLVLTRRFLDLFLTVPDGCLDLRSAIASLRTRRRRVYDITNVLQGVRLVQKESVNRIRWM